MDAEFENSESGTFDYNEPHHIVLDSVIYVFVESLPEAEGYREYELIEADPIIPLDLWMMVQYLKIPMAIIEYIDNLSEASNRTEHHKNHLLMAMSTSLAFYTFLKLTHPVFGFLIDRTRVDIFIRWHAEASDSFR
jgi:hypothetical protein